MQPVIYSKRRNPMSRGEREWRVEESVLRSVSAGGRERRLAWSDVVSVRVRRCPARARPWRYVFTLQSKDGRKTEIDNCHLVSMGAYQDRSASFTPFVRAALARIAASSPKARALFGETPRRYLFLLLVSLLGFAALAVGLIVVRTPLDSLPYAAAVKLGVTLLMLPIFWHWVLGAMPRGVTLDQVPDRALPPSDAPCRSEVKNG